MLDLSSHCVVKTGKVASYAEVSGFKQCFHVAYVLQYR